MAVPPAAGAPSLNTESAAVPEVGGSERETSVAVPDTLINGNALIDNAVEFTGDTDRPIMSIVLIDAGQHPELRGGLAAMDAPVTFGVTANIDSVGEVSSQYRQNGFEIVAVMPDVGPLAVNRETDLDDIEVLMAGILTSVPGSTTILDPIDSPLPQNRRMAGAVLEALTQTGHGLLTHRGNGLNNVPIIADQEGVTSE